MQARCPHCGALNEFVRPPTTAVVYCRQCQRPFGSQVGSGQTPLPSIVSGRAVPVAPSRAAASAGVGPSSASNFARFESDDGRESTTPFRSGRPSAAVAAQVIVPKTRPTSDEQSDQAKLVYRNSDGMETEFGLEATTTVGRHPKNDIRLNDREISKEHAVIERRGADYYVRDLRSSNGTFVNSRRVTDAHLKDGDELLLGSMRLQFVVDRRQKDRHSVRDLVTILPQDPGTTTHIHAKLEGDEDLDFKPVDLVTDIEVLKRDYEKLRLTQGLSRIGLTLDLSVLLTKTLDVVFSMLPADNAVIMLVDEDTNTLVPHTVRQRDPKNAKDRKQEILLSSTILNQVLNERASVLSSDAFVDPRFSGAQSIIAQGIRAAMAVPLIAHDHVLGIMHLDSRERVGAFTEKDLRLLKAIAVQTAIAIENTRLVRQIEEEAKTRGQLSRFLPPHVVEDMVNGRGRPIQKGGRELEATVVFCDIRGFTSLAENTGPQEIVDLLNDYFEHLVDVVFRYHGVLDKFIGDALMASWGTLDSDQDQVVRAVAAALEFRDTIRGLNRERRLEGLPPINMGVGVNTGRLVAGYMGSKRRLEYTVVGDTVNTASRLCSVAAGDQVLISESTHRHVADRVEARYLGPRQVKGKEQELGVYELVRVLESYS
ncbi:MAG: FHA domain-containing protein [Deltaproteobacteria bacterium]|nr:FHA domain-containing protein [Deltaproteobacteria bacterium]